MKPLALLLWSACVTFAAPVPKELRRPPVIDIRDPDGNVLIPAADLLGYDWDTHTLTLNEGAKAKLFDGRNGTPRTEKFVVCIDGTPAFAARFYSVFLGGTYREPGVVFTFKPPADTDTKLHIQAAYPNDDFARGDKRQVPELKAALEKAGKLKAEKK